MGINMPTKTVIFPSLQKFDGLKQCFLTPGSSRRCLRAQAAAERTMQGT